MSDDLLRPCYFNGQRLSADDLTAEQTFQVAARHRLNQLLLLPGIVEGLQIVISNGAYVAPGAAIDGLGRELVLAQAVALDADFLRDHFPSIKDGFFYYVFLRYWEEPANRSSASTRSATAGGQVIRITESAEVVLSESPPPPLPKENDVELGVVLGRIRVRSRDSGEIDNTVDGSDRRFIGVRAQRLQAPSRPLVDEPKEVADTAAGQEPKMIEIVSPLHAQKAVTIAGTLTALEKTSLSGEVTARGNLLVGGVTKLGDAPDPEHKDILPPLEPAEEFTFGGEAGTLGVGHHAIFHKRLYLRVAENDQPKFIEIQKFITDRFNKIFEDALLTKVAEQVQEQLPKRVPEVIMGEEKIFETPSSFSVVDAPTFSIVLPKTKVEGNVRVTVQIALRGMVLDPMETLKECGLEVDSPPTFDAVNREGNLTIKWTAEAESGTAFAVKKFFYAVTTVYSPAP